MKKYLILFCALFVLSAFNLYAIDWNAVVKGLGEAAKILNNNNNSPGNQKSVNVSSNNNPQAAATGLGWQKDWNGFYDPDKGYKTIKYNLETNTQKDHWMSVNIFELIENCETIVYVKSNNSDTKKGLTDYLLKTSNEKLKSFNFYRQSSRCKFYIYVDTTGSNVLVMTQVHADDGKYRSIYYQKKINGSFPKYKNISDYVNKEIENIFDYAIAANQLEYPKNQAVPTTVVPSSQTQGKTLHNCPHCVGGYNICSYCNGGKKFCMACNGHGHRSDKKALCSVCGGAGYKLCTHCGGVGKTLCKKCGGSGSYLR